MWEDTHCRVTHVWAWTPHPQTQPWGLRLPRTDHTPCPSGRIAPCSSHYICILFWWGWSHLLNFLWVHPHLFMDVCDHIFRYQVHFYMLSQCSFSVFVFCSKQWWLRIPLILKFNVTMEVVKTLGITRRGRRRWENTRYGVLYVLFAGSCQVTTDSPVLKIFSS